jgi:hypothetical protein
MASTTSSFDSTRWYRFSNTETGPNITLSSGIDQSTNGAINMTIIQSYSSSENWQLFFQSGIYFIRNYDYSTMQLGVSVSDTSLPSLMNPTGDLGQQWTISQRSDGNWKIQNELLGNVSTFGISAGNTVPGMEPSDTGSEWNISINLSAGQITDSALLSTMSNIAVRPFCQSVYACFLVGKLVARSSRRFQESTRPFDSVHTLFFSGMISLLHMKLSYCQIANMKHKIQ